MRWLRVRQEYNHMVWDRTGLIAWAVANPLGVGLVLAVAVPSGLPLTLDTAKGFLIAAAVLNALYALSAWLYMLMVSPRWGDLDLGAPFPPRWPLPLRQRLLVTDELRSRYVLVPALPAWPSYFLWVVSFFGGIVAFVAALR